MNQYDRLGTKATLEGEVLEVRREAELTVFIAGGFLHGDSCDENRRNAELCTVFVKAVGAWQMRQKKWSSRESEDLDR